MELFINYWYIFVAILSLIIIVGIAIYKFAELPTKSQIIKIKQWLLFAVTKAESELGTGTGKIKLHTVYDLFISKFPITARIITFETFSLWVDDALKEMKTMLENNENIKELVETKSV